jgi:hypothetical protein
VCSVPIEIPAAERARWLAELSEALNGAHRVIRCLDLQSHQREEAIELYLRIEAARLEVQSLRLSRSLTPRQEIHPDWNELPPWERVEPRSV